jgi:hypothetical protein
MITLNKARFRAIVKDAEISQKVRLDLLGKDREELMSFTIKAENNNVFKA